MRGCISATCCFSYCALLLSWVLVPSEVLIALWSTSHHLNWCVFHIYHARLPEISPPHLLLWCLQCTLLKDTPAVSQCTLSTPGAPLLTHQGPVKKCDISVSLYKAGFNTVLLLCYLKSIPLTEKFHFLFK